MRKTFVFYGLISSFATLFTPLAVQLDFGLLLIMRVLQAMLTLIVFGCFFIFYRDSPRIHRNVSRKELCKIEHGKLPIEDGPVARNGEIPYADILRDPAVWAIFLCSMGTTFGFHIFMQYGPVYLNQIIKFNVQRTGLAMAFSCFLSIFVKLVVGSVSDRANCLSERSRVVLFASLSQFLVAICFCSLALLPQGSPPILVQCFFTSVPVVSGLNCAGVGKSTQMISRQFAHVVISFSVFACSTTIIIIPILVSFLAPDNRPEQVFFKLKNLEENNLSGLEFFLLLLL
ncbi:hypothetical protein Mgra_00002374 [Meloidogyne graminicola]|uniref:Uncharacterized protein n=1 Tax=Meloidogyne graminicola TaxID=189291 RepID=A0A8S9ZXX5_9BILA|nr:hypothetical protein Mgra_00002374 [Meloidogyne graminicola]